MCHRNARCSQWGKWRADVRGWGRVCMRDFVLSAQLPCKTETSLKNYVCEFFFFLKFVMAAEVIRTLIGDPLSRWGKATLEMQPSSNFITIAWLSSPGDKELQWSLWSAWQSCTWATFQSSGGAYVSRRSPPGIVLDSTAWEVCEAAFSRITRGKLSVDLQVCCKDYIS